MSPKSLSTTFRSPYQTLLRTIQELMESPGMEKKDILLLGASGFTGRLILKYLTSHPTRTQSNVAFTLGLAGRSADKLRRVAAEVGANNIPIHELDIQSEQQVRMLFTAYRVVITSVGPFWHYGKVVAKVCAELGVHYVDITGEPHFIRYLVEQYDFLATKTGSILIPASGFDSVPSDLSAFYGVSALRRVYGSDVQAGKSTSAFAVRGQSISGGTAATMLDIFGGGIPAWVRRRLRDPWLLSPMIGTVPSPKFVYHLPCTSILGFFYPMSPVNGAVVRRTWGLYELNARDSAATTPEMPYGSRFEYEEFLECGNYLVAILGSFAIGLFFGLMAISSAFRWFVQHFLLYKPGSGPDERKFGEGWLRLTNVTSSDEEKPRAVKSVIRGKGEPGYFLTSVMVGEIALALLPPNRERLTALAKKGGVLTPASALGQELVERLKRTGRFEFNEEQVYDELESRKDR
ncbi:hypothetical protein M407DRAFT_21940 [Tulasnella calospora MUT 4182]|uniref:Saccharopine dehydrogenase NADP binding domain-containing protein n=1 Tax=Tulasnella calospora MUT 4182 TaxID=1051891 RepID=A0A0C3L543_9AGAM|nr:hypothetical protein M407DRAFT_21940 [Tulasnella calospora MUT 4182]